MLRLSVFEQRYLRISDRLQWTIFFDDSEVRHKVLDHVFRRVRECEQTRATWTFFYMPSDHRPCFTP